MRFRTKRLILNILSSIFVLITILAGFFAIVNFSFQVAYSQTHVIGYSMLPTLNENVYDTLALDGEKTQGDYIFINNFKQAKVGDIVVAKVDWNKELIIKRLVGLPGDIVEIKENEETFDLLVNDKILYSKPKTDRSLDNKSSEGGTIGYFNKYNLFLQKYSNNVIEREGKLPAIEIKQGECLLLGDNWGGTTDCMDYGVARVGNIVGRVDLVVDYGDNVPLEVMKFVLKNLFN